MLYKISPLKLIQPLLINSQWENSQCRVCYIKWRLKVILKRSLIVIRACIQDCTGQRRTKKHSSGRWLDFGHVSSMEQSKPKRSWFLDRCLFILAKQLVSEDMMTIKLGSLWHLDSTHSHKAIPHHVQIPNLEKTKTRVYRCTQVVAHKIFPFIW